MSTTNQIKVEVHFTLSHLDELQLKDKNVVVIDVLRSSTTIAAALQNGAKEIIPVSDIESAVKISGSLFGGVVLRGGERNGKMIEGFNLGNSPGEYTEQAVKNKSIIMLTTNGTVAIVKGRHAKNLVVGSFVNLSAVVALLDTLHDDVVIVCAGKENRFCLEDAICAGKIIDSLAKEGSVSMVLDDAATASSALAKTFGKTVLRMLKNSEHGRYLTSIGFANDLKVCSQIDSIPVLPVLSGSTVRLKKESSQPIRQAKIIGKDG